MKRLLVVEDVELNRELMRQLLEDDYALEFAVDGEEALAKVNLMNFDAILLDISIPKIDGYEVAQTIRKLGKSTPIIAVTAHAMDGDRAKMIDSGCNDCVTKPVDESLLFAAIENYVS